MKKNIKRIFGICCLALIAVYSINHVLGQGRVKMSKASPIFKIEYRDVTLYPLDFLIGESNRLYTLSILNKRLVVSIYDPAGKKIRTDKIPWRNSYMGALIHGDGIRAYYDSGIHFNIYNQDKNLKQNKVLVYDVSHPNQSTISCRTCPINMGISYAVIDSKNNMVISGQLPIAKQNEDEYQKSYKPIMVKLDSKDRVVWMNDKLPACDSYGDIVLDSGDNPIAAGTMSGAGMMKCSAVDGSILWSKQFPIQNQDRVLYFGKLRDDEVMVFDCQHVINDWDWNKDRYDKIITFDLSGKTKQYQLCVESNTGVEDAAITRDGDIYTVFHEGCVGSDDIYSLNKYTKEGKRIWSEYLQFLHPFCTPKMKVAENGKIYYGDSRQDSEIEAITHVHLEPDPMFAPTDVKGFIYAIQGPK